MIGDRPDNDIGGANAVGMRTIRVRPGLYAERPVREGEVADAEIENIRDLPGLLL